MDVDGVLTDGKIIFSSSGEELKMFDIQDGMGIAMAHRAGFKTGIITSRTSSMVKRRARELKINYVSQGTEKKLEAYEICLNQLKINDEDVCYIGDDLLDIPVLKRVGFSVAVANSRDELKEFCNYVTEHKGGGGAVREVIEKILKAQGKFTEVLQQIIQ
jgi:3-deoxy-D-manno-octulosonate 8-phosphate phosphatase (KDO 8-P phosphatase)